MNSTIITFGKLQAMTGILAEKELRATLAVCSGLSNKQIAKALDCAPGTVKKAIERTFFKLKVSSRAALVAEAFKRGLIAFACAAPASPDPQRQQDQDHQGVFIA